MCCDAGSWLAEWKPSDASILPRAALHPPRWSRNRETAAKCAQETAGDWLWLWMGAPRRNLGEHKRNFKIRVRRWHARRACA